MILKSQALKLLADDTFVAVFVSMRAEQVKKFLNSSKDDSETREEAHAMTRALNEFDYILKRAITDQDIKDKRIK
tara:strand:- start:132 stop:356 length:225 start_codon:yes stop_codon:yes gene_type:complete